MLLRKGNFGVRTFRALVVVPAACLLPTSPHILGCRAFTTQVMSTGAIIGKRPLSSIYPKAVQTPTTALHANFFSDFLGSFQDKMNAGGSYNLGIDYETLEFPGPEVGAMAVRIAHALENEGDALAPSASPSLPHLELATFAGGCFWGLELALRRCEGVEHALAGYTMGREVRPNYEQVSAGNTGHREAVLVYFDPSVVSYERVVRSVVLDRLDVTTVDGQGKDFGNRYRTGIYYHTSEQEEIARRLLGEELATNPKYARTNKVVATEVRPAGAFWSAEGYHQRYLERGGRSGQPQSAEKGNKDEIRCYG